MSTTTQTETITTSFPLGLFCNATLSGPIPKAKAVETFSTSHKTNRKTCQKPKNLPAIDPQAKGWMKDSSWTIAAPDRES